MNGCVAKWSAPIRKYWKISEQMMVKYCDLAICDSVNIESIFMSAMTEKGLKEEIRKLRLSLMVQRPNRVSCRIMI